MVKHVEVSKPITIDGHKVAPGLYQMADEFYYRCKAVASPSIVNFNRTMIYASIQEMCRPNGN